MGVTILFFGTTADAVGKREIEKNLSSGSTVAEVIEQLKHEHPALSKSKLLVALNEEYASLNTPVQKGDTLAVFSTVSGG